MFYENYELKNNVKTVEVIKYETVEVEKIVKVTEACSIEVEAIDESDCEEKLAWTNRGYQSLKNSLEAKTSELEAIESSNNKTIKELEIRRDDLKGYVVELELANGELIHECVNF